MDPFAGDPARDASQAEFAQSIANLHAWFETMRQPGGYGGPVAHWWQSRYQYTGPGLDWRYEGILHGYSMLFDKTGDDRWRRCIEAAALDLVEGQNLDGSYRASCFEINPGTLGTPHEAAASLGLLRSLPYVQSRDVPATIERNLSGIVRRLWDAHSGGFNDRPGVMGRVPNKLATLALTLMTYVQVSGNADYLSYARSALDDVLRYQVEQGTHRGAVHQYAPDHGRGDGRFFPYYNARCIPALMVGAATFGDERYAEAARGIMAFLQGTATAGVWPQIVYATGRRAMGPSWIAGTADILLAYISMNEPFPTGTLSRILGGQLPSGGFRTGTGFARQIVPFRSNVPPDLRDVTPVAGWNDKVLRLLTTIISADSSIPEVTSTGFETPIQVHGRSGTYREDNRHIEAVDSRGRCVYLWNKQQPWATVTSGTLAR